jgi:hypothetical protein
MAESTYHEPVNELDAEARDFHRALSSLMEELEAVDWYHQRVVTTGNDQLRAVLAHNRNEEVEHAMMTLEWIRRTSPTFDKAMRTYLFTTAAIETIEETEKAERESGVERTPAARQVGSMTVDGKFAAKPDGKPVGTINAGTGRQAGVDMSLGIGSLKAV